MDGLCIHNSEIAEALNINTSTHKATFYKVFFRWIINVWSKNETLIKINRNKYAYIQFQLNVQILLDILVPRKKYFHEVRNSFVPKN